MRHAIRFRLSAALAMLAALSGLAVLTAPGASAHPLGNFTVNYYSGITVQPKAILVSLVVDRAEIPTLQTFPDAAIGVQPAGADAWKAAECATLAHQATLRVDNQRQPLAVTSTRLQLLPGTAGLATSRLECQTRTHALRRTVGAAVTYQAAPTGGHVGWHEVTARGDGVILTGSSVPAVSVSKQLTAYPVDLLASPLNLRSARFTVAPGTGVVAADVTRLPSSSPLYGLDTLTTTYTALVSRTSLTPAFALLALLLSLVLGGMHAFAPGHGKTLMAAYLVGREGTWRQAAVIGLSVTVTHTIGVLLLGVALSGAAIAAPETVYPWLGLISGLMLAGIGVTLLRSARRGHIHGPGGHTHGPGGHTHGPGGHTHGSDGHIHGPGDAATPHHPPVSTVGAAVNRTHPAMATGDGALLTLTAHAADEHDHEHHHHQHDHHHEQEQHHEREHEHHEHEHAAHDRRHRLRSTGRLAAVGLVGGMVPSPSALLVLLGGIALGRAWFGAVLVVAYGVGMATALVGTGLLLVIARDRVERWSARADRRVLPGHALVLRWTRRLPLVTAVSVILVGAWIAVRSVAGI